MAVRIASTLVREPVFSDASELWVHDRSPSRGSGYAGTLVYELLADPVISSHLDALGEHHSESLAHSLRVAFLSLGVGIENGIAIDRLTTLGCGALLHDIGKRSIPPSVLEKQGSLSGEERRMMREHVRIGYEAVRNEQLPEGVGVIIVSHHEYQRNPYPRTDHANGRGRSYRGEWDDLAQIVAACDMFDAVSKPRSYKKAHGITSVRRIMADEYRGDPRFLPQVLRC